ncbi:hypothetical protein BH11PLA2_BH11PLA2_06960 [soil metagenome]
MKQVLSVIVMLVGGLSTQAAKIVLVAGGGDGPDGGPATKAKLVTPFGVDFDSKGRLYFVEMEKGERLRTIEPDGTIKTVAGTGKKGDKGDNGFADVAEFNGMHGLAISKEGAVFLADTWNNRVRRFDNEGGKIYNFAGTGEKGFAGDGGHITTAMFGGTFGICYDKQTRNIYIADLGNARIRKFNEMELIISTVAGNGKKAVPKDGGKAVDEPLLDPRACAIDTEGNLYILERGGHSLRVVNKDGIIKTVMGTGKAGTAVGKALESQMNGPKHLCIDKDNCVIIADAENHRVLRFEPKTNMVSVVAGTGKRGSDGLDGDPLKCKLNRPHGVTVHPKTGELYIVDSYNDRILKITP